MSFTLIGDVGKAGILKKEDVPPHPGPKIVWFGFKHSIINPLDSLRNLVPVVKASYEIMGLLWIMLARLNSPYSLRNGTDDVCFGNL